MTRFKVMRLLALLSLSLFLSGVQAGEHVSKSLFGGVAIDGHDTVAYHKVGEADPHKASKGSKSWNP